MEALYRYPVKGLPGQSLPHAHLTAGQGLPLDRVFGLTEGAAPVEPDAHGWISSELLLRLRKHAELGLCRLETEPDALLLTTADGRKVRIPLDGPLGPVGDIRLVRPGASLWDWSDAPLSVINLDTVEALAQAAGVPVDPLRFRANLYVSGLGAWRELDLPGARVRLGEAELEFTFPVERCRATTIRPGTGVRDLNVPALLASRFGHLYCGMYARVVRGGRIDPGAPLVDRGRAPAQPRYAARLAEPGRPRYAELIRRTRESPTVTTFAFHDRAGAHCRPGQHLRLHLADETGPLWRCYTITGASDTELRISVKRVRDGRVSGRLHALPTGARVLLSGPYGDDLMDSDQSRPLLMAVAGIGITPVLPILRALLDADSERPVTVLNVVRTSTETPLWEEALALLAKLPNATARLHVTDPGPGLPYGAHAGRPTTAELGELAADGTVEAYLCGPQAFVDTVRAALLSAGVPADAVRDERFLSPRPVSLDERPPPAPGPFTVHYTASGTRTTWTADSGTLLDTAESAGLRLPSACRSGACGTCRKRVTGTVAHLTEPAARLESGQALLCCAVPVGDVEVHG
nr:MOSC domain-containing protein [Streptomyces sp. S3(2020)]